MLSASSPTIPQCPSADLECWKRAAAELKIELDTSQIREKSLSEQLALQIDSTKTCLDIEKTAFAAADQAMGLAKPMLPHWYEKPGVMLGIGVGVGVTVTAAIAIGLAYAFAHVSVTTH